MMTERVMLRVELRITTFFRQVLKIDIRGAAYLCAMLKSTLIRAAEAGAAVMQHYFEGEFVISNKEGVNNLVTEADHASEKAIFEVIRHDFPDHFLLSEETGEVVTGSEYKWIIDPIDGTVNFAHGLPICCVSIGIEQRGEVIMARYITPSSRSSFLRSAAMARP